MVSVEVDNRSGVEVEEQAAVELARDFRGQLVTPVDRKREDVRRFVDPDVLALERTALVDRHEEKSDLGILDPLGREHAPSELGRRLGVDLLPAPVRDLDGDHRFRCVPVSSACSLYASTIR